MEVKEPAIVYNTQKLTAEEYLQMERVSKQSMSIFRAKYWLCRAQAQGIMLSSGTYLENWLKA
jgi:hypothetical protein